MRQGVKYDLSMAQGLRVESVAVAISVPRFLTSSYEIRENGAASPGRWQVTQLSYTIGAMLSANVTLSAAGSSAAVARKATNNFVVIVIYSDSYLLRMSRGTM